MKKHTKVVLSRIVASALVVGAMFSNVIADPALDTAPAALKKLLTPLLLQVVYLLVRATKLQKKLL